MMHFTSSNCTHYLLLLLLFLVLFFLHFYRVYDLSRLASKDWNCMDYFSLKKGIIFLPLLFGVVVCHYCSETSLTVLNVFIKVKLNSMTIDRPLSGRIQLYLCDGFVVSVSRRKFG